MGEGTVFSLLCQFTPRWGEGYPHSRSRWGEGVPHHRSGWWGYPHLRSRQGVPPSQVRKEEVPHPADRGTLIPGQDRGYLHPRSGQGGISISSQNGGGYPILLMGEYSILPIGGTLIPGQDGAPLPGQDGGGGYPQLEQHTVYLLRSGRHASCVHAGGVSCCFFKIAGRTA